MRGLAAVGIDDAALDNPDGWVPTRIEDDRAKLRHTLVSEHARFVRTDLHFGMRETRYRPRTASPIGFAVCSARTCAAATHGSAARLPLKMRPRTVNRVPTAEVTSYQWTPHPRHSWH